jgi:hypothetical protein
MSERQYRQFTASQKIEIVCEANQPGVILSVSVRPAAYFAVAGR